MDIEALLRVKLGEHERALETLEAQNTAISALLQVLMTALQAKGAVSKDEIAVTLQGAAQLIEKVLPPETAGPALKALKVFQNGALLETPGPKGHGEGRQH